MNNYSYMNPPNMGGYPMQQQPVQQQAPMKMVNPMQFETPTVSTGDSAFKFSVGKSSVAPVDIISDVEKEDKKRGGRKKKSSTESGGKIIRSTKDGDEPIKGVVEDSGTSYSYMETTEMLKGTLAQIDTLNSELMEEFESIKRSRTMKNKYNALTSISENVSSLISSRIAAIREINSSISKSNDLDYKKFKDRQAADAALDDDKYIADLYKSFISQPKNLAPGQQMPPIDPAIFGSSIVRANVSQSQASSNGPIDTSYLQYMSNLTPEQNLMRYENNPNVKQVLVFDVSTGNKFFQYMDMATGEVITNAPTYDIAMFENDISLDMNNGIAKILNINETFPIVKINEGVTAEY